MGKIQSAATIYATAYLTEKGRTYLFNKGNIRFDSSGNDLFQITTFTLSDLDTNYLTSERLISGDIPDVTGKSEGCLKATTDYVQSTFAYYTIDSASLADPQYRTNVPGDILVIGTDTAFPTNSSTDVPPSTTTISSGSGSGTIIR